MDPRKQLEHHLKFLTELRASAAKKLFESEEDARLDAWSRPAIRDVRKILGDDDAMTVQEAYEVRGLTSIKAATLIDIFTRFVAQFEGAAQSAPDLQPADDLLAHAAGIRDDHVRAFVQEAVGCYQNGHHRAAIVLSWAGAVGVLQEKVVSDHLTAFNAEAHRRNPKWNAAVSREDLGEMKEHNLLEVLDAIGVLSKHQKQALQRALTLRNSCGHPTSLAVGPRAVAAHVESLIQNVFLKFA